MRFCTLVVFVAGAVTASAELTIDQRIHDFTNLASTYAKRYAPYEWKRQAVGFDLYDIGPWLERVRGAKDDLAFLEICAEYVARLDDTHSSFSSGSSFTADLGLAVDIYDGKVLIESVNRARLPVSQFLFQIGDELVSVDGKSVEQLIAEFSRLRRRGHPRATRRGAADLIVFRPQSVIPRAVEVGDSAVVEIRRASGDVEKYTLPWAKTGLAVHSIGPVPTPKTATRTATDTVPDFLRELTEMRNWSLPEGDHLLRGTTFENDAEQERRFILGLGSRFPVFRPGLPANFVQRLGSGATDFHFSGVYEARGMRIGYLRFPNFSPFNSDSAIQELEREVRFFQENTDGLVVDVMRNTGGGCYMLDAAARLIPYPFYFFGEEIRATQGRLNSLQFAIEAARRQNADRWIIETYQFYFDQVAQALRENRGRTGAIPACTKFGSDWPPILTNPPATVVYSKPLIVLIDEFSISAGDIFPSMLQDNRRGLLVGTRTNGAGGSVSGIMFGTYSEALAGNTNTLVVRREPVVTSDYPTAPYIENIGARADIPLDYMIRDNLMSSGRPFVQAFTDIMIEHIERSPH